MRSIPLNPPLSYDAIKPYLKGDGTDIVMVGRNSSAFELAYEISTALCKLLDVRGGFNILVVKGDILDTEYIINEYRSKGNGSS